MVTGTPAFTPNAPINDESRMDEPIKTTIYRDLSRVYEKLKYVMSPASRQEQGGILKKWDLWGPLFLCLVLSVMLWIKAESDQKQSVFALIFILQWAGAAAVTVNASLLGSAAPFFQCLCVLGYSAFPLVGAAAACLMIPHYLALLRLVFVGLGVYHSLTVASGFMATLASVEKRALVLYPVGLYYVVLGWVIIIV